MQPAPLDIVRYMYTSSLDDVVLIAALFIAESLHVLIFFVAFIFCIFLLLR